MHKDTINQIILHSFDSAGMPFLKIPRKHFAIIDLQEKVGDEKRNILMFLRAGHCSPEENYLGFFGECDSHEFFRRWKCQSERQPAGGARVAH